MATADRASIAEVLKAFQTRPLREAVRHLLAHLGYESDRLLLGADSSPQAFLGLFPPTGSGLGFDPAKALVSDWRTAELVFQLTDRELGRQSSLFTDTSVSAGLLQSYVFIAIDLNGGDYPRGKFSAMARQINRLFPMPVMVFFKHHDLVTIAVINRRRNKIDETKDILGKVTLIRAIDVADPHPGHLDILSSLALPNLVHPQKQPIRDFETLHAAWEQIFNIELLNERFYRELANWYFWALPQVDFPSDLEKDSEKRRATGLIRLLTRLLFCWFLKEKGLVPGRLFHPADVETLLTDLDPDSSSYYQAILQNLFFATLNQRMGKDGKGKPYRAFALDEGFPRNRATYDVNNLYRYESLFQAPSDALSIFEDIPFLNGGLFECLDRTEEASNKKRYLDGFSRNPKKRPTIPNRLFFGGEVSVDLSDSYGDAKHGAERVSGLIRILARYKFTIVENTPIDQEIALDPELLGKVFENLLASYNEETRTTARKQTGSFYTPRSIVDYMVDESLKAHLTGALVDRAGMEVQAARSGLNELFAYTERPHTFAQPEVACLINAIDTMKVLDPACGSGAFPMGVLHKLVYILGKLDPDNCRWKETQLAKLDSAPMREELRKAFEANNDDYGRKLYLIENCLYGVDVQPIAIQITKLRFFISLVCDQKTSRNRKDNFGVRPLPNLETKFVAADTLIGLPEIEQTPLLDPRVAVIEREIETHYHTHFSIQRRDLKLALQRKVKILRSELADILSRSLMSAKKSEHIAEWDPFDPQSSADFFDPHWMFGLSLVGGFDIVIGNPPYVSVEKFAGTPMQDRWKATFATYAARGDVYCFFYERGVQLLSPGGHLCYITSNKWMRAGYGEALRGLLASLNTEAVLDFGMAQNFGAATTYTCILRVAKEAPTGSTRACYVADDRDAMANPEDYFIKHAVVLTRLGTNPWVVTSPERQEIRTNVVEQGIQLAKWAVQISRGIITGYNEAFYLSREQSDALIREDPASSDLIVKLLRGRDIERYRTSWSDGYQLIVKFGAHETLEDRYPAVFRHLLAHKTQLQARAQCRYGRERRDRTISKAYPGQHHWLELDNNPTDEYLAQFRLPKIIYSNMTKYFPFYFDPDEHFYCNQKCFIVTSKTEPLEYLAAVLNSSLFRCCFRDNFPELLGNTYELSKIFMDKIPIKKPDAATILLFAKLVPLVGLAKSTLGAAPGASAFLDDLADACVMECYFQDHMEARDLLFHNIVAPYLATYSPHASGRGQLEFLGQFYRTLNDPGHPIRNRLLRLTAESPDLLAIIKEEGAP